MEWSLLIPVSAGATSPEPSQLANGGFDDLPSEFHVTLAHHRNHVTENQRFNQPAVPTPHAQPDAVAGRQLRLRAHLSGRSSGLPNNRSVWLPQERLSEVRLLLQHLPRLVHPAAVGGSRRDEILREEKGATFGCHTKLNERSEIQNMLSHESSSRGGQKQGEERSECRHGKTCA